MASISRMEESGSQPTQALPEAVAESMSLVYEAAGEDGELRKGQFRLFVGDLDAAWDLGQLKRAGVTTVVNCCVSNQGRKDKTLWAPFAGKGLRYGVVDTNDDASDLCYEDPTGQWPAVMALLRECAAAGEAALVHCWMGKNRSVVTAAVFLALEGLVPEVGQALRLIRARRPAAEPLPAYVAFAEDFVARERARSLPPAIGTPPGDHPADLQGTSWAGMHLVFEAKRSGLFSKPFRLFVGDVGAANRLEALQQAGVTTIINCCVADLGPGNKLKWTPHQHKGLRYGVLNTNDNAADLQKEDPASQWPAVMALLRECASRGEAALVHCWVGKNRSVATAATFLALEGHVAEVQDGVKLIKTRRPLADPKPEYVRFAEVFVARERLRAACGQPAASDDSMHLVFQAPTSSASGQAFRLYVGSRDAAGDLDCLTRLGVTTVVNCGVADMDPSFKPAWTPFVRQGLRYGVVDTDEGDPHLSRQDPRGQWPAVMALLRECCEAGEAALVHCWSSMGRSAVTAAVFLTLAGLVPSVQEALALIRARCPAVDPKSQYVTFAETFVEAERERAVGNAASAGATSYPLPTGLPVDPGAPIQLVFQTPGSAASGKPFRLYVGDIFAARDFRLLQTADVTTVVNCCVADMKPNKREWAPFAHQGVRYAVVNTQDTAIDLAQEDPSGQWAAVVALLKECKAAGETVLIHCYAGKNRSVTTAAVFLTLAGFVPEVQEAINLIRCKRSVVAPLLAYVEFAEAFVEVERRRIAAVKGQRTVAAAAAD